MTAKLIDGKRMAEAIEESIAAEVKVLKGKYNVVPGLAVVIVGDDPASHTYVNMKQKTTISVGMTSEVIRLPKETTQEELIEVVHRLNEDEKIHGILVQVPLPKGLDEHIINSHVKPEKDVDGFHAINTGKLFLGDVTIVPCTPKGIIELIKSTGTEISGKNAVVVGRSNILGKPAAILLLQENATVTICHSRTQDLKDHIQRADIVVAAVGSAELIKGHMIKPGAVVIDAGTTVVNGKLVGDVEFATASEVASYITPVPGGVGPMTIAMLLENTLEATKKKCK